MNDMAYNVPHLYVNNPNTAHLYSENVQAQNIKIV